MKKGVLFGFVTLLAACGPHSPSPGGNDGGGCSPGQMTFAVEGVTFTSTCFDSTSPGGPLFPNAQVEVEAHGTVSSQGGAGSGGPQIMFSNASTCQFSAGQTVQLTDPCIFVADTPGDEQPATWSGRYQGWVNNCTSTAFPSPATNEQVCVVVAQYNLPMQSQGSLTINQWSTAPNGTIQVTFSSGAQATAYWLPPGAQTPTSVSVQLGGTVTSVNAR